MLAPVGGQAAGDIGGLSLAAPDVRFVDFGSDQFVLANDGPPLRLLPNPQGQIAGAPASQRSGNT
jgi:hypothetical protein